MGTGSQSGIVKPVNRLSLYTSSISYIIKSLFLSLKDHQWCNAKYDKYNALVKNGTRILVPRPLNVNLVRFMWLFKHKFHADGTLSRYKAPLVTNGSSQQLVVDFDETFSPVVKPATSRIVFSLVVSRKWPIHQLDVKNAFLNGDLSETRSLYGLKQAPRAWFSGLQICLYMHDPRETHCAALKRILRYVQGTLKFGLHLYVFTTSSFVGYTDADWEGFPFTRMSTSGYCVFFGDNLLSWSSKRQHTLSRSSSEAEYRGVANVVAETAWIRNLLRELHSPLSTTTIVYCDNVSAIYMSANHVQHQRMKHIEIDIHFVCDMVTVGQVRVLNVPSHYHYTDIFTKGLLLALFEDFWSSLSVRLPLTPTARAY
nr:ribonuclease H-like domain-containing protein [Tanacetum cinerariifolium]